MHEYYIKRKDKVHEKYVNDKKDKMKDYYKQNKESLLKKVKEYQYKNRDDIKNYRNEYYLYGPIKRRPGYKLTAIYKKRKELRKKKSKNDIIIKREEVPSFTLRI